MHASTLNLPHWNPVLPGRSPNGGCLFSPCPVQEAAESKWSYVAFAKAYPSAQLGSEAVDVGAVMDPLWWNSYNLYVYIYIYRRGQPGSAVSSLFFIRAVTVSAWHICNGYGMSLLCNHWQFRLGISLSLYIHIYTYIYIITSSICRPRNNLIIATVKTSAADLVAQCVIERKSITEVDWKRNLVPRSQISSSSCSFQQEISIVGVFSCRTRSPLVERIQWTKGWVNRIGPKNGCLVY